MHIVKIFLGIILIASTGLLFRVVLGAKFGWQVGLLYLVFLLLLGIAVYSFFYPNTSYLIWILIAGLIINTGIGVWMTYMVADSFNSFKENSAKIIELERSQIVAQFKLAIDEDDGV